MLVLVVEDEPQLLALAHKILNHGGYDVILATDGATAVTQALEAEPAPALVLMDLALPRMDGWEATAIIKARKPHLPVIAVSAHAMISDRQRSEDAGFDDFLSKPYRRDDLIAAVAKYLPSGP
jgi:CheY-like chemotaxis protein